MRRRAAYGLSLALALSLLSAPATAKLGPGGFMSDNVTWVAHLPIDSPGIGGRVVQVGAQKRFYVTGVKGLSIYDVTNPAIPIPLGLAPYPHWENEDVEVSADGSTVLIAGDSGTGISAVFDTSIPTVPRFTGVIPGFHHTLSCADRGCNYAYSSEGPIIDLRNRSAPIRIARRWDESIDGRGGHDLNLASDGRMVSDSSTRLLLDVSNPEDPQVLTTGTLPTEPRLAYQHNNLRPRAELWQPRAAGDNDPALRPGELLLAEGETNGGLCNSGSGPFATWSVRDFDKGRPMEPLHVFRPVNGNYEDGNPALNVLGCSGHWFSERNGLVAAGWYEHGTRILDVNQATGVIAEAGFFQPVVGSASAAHWVDDEYIYTVDYARGIDILRFDRSAPRPSRSEIERSWLAKLKVRSPLAEAERYSCRIATA